MDEQPKTMDHYIIELNLNGIMEFRNTVIHNWIIILCNMKRSLKVLQDTSYKTPALLRGSVSGTGQAT